MQYRMPPPTPDSEQSPDRMGKWEMLATEFINSATHVTNTDQRLLELVFKTLHNEMLKMQVPMPHGYCMLC
jgi:hypothetical protein